MEDVDFDDIKRYDTSYLQHRFSKINLDFNIPKESQYSKWAPAQNVEDRKYSEKHFKDLQNVELKTLDDRKQIDVTNIGDTTNTKHLSKAKKNEKITGTAPPSPPKAPPGLQR